MANNARDLAWKVLAAGAAVVGIIYFSKASNTILDPIIDDQTQKQKKRQAKRNVTETTGDKVLISGKKRNGKLVKPYYVNLTTLAFQLNDYFHGNPLITYDKEARDAIFKTMPRYMPRLAEIYEAQTGKPLLQDIAKYMHNKYQAQLGHYPFAV